MPPKLILSSGTARAEHSNSSLEEVLANWAGTSLEELQQQAAEAPSSHSPQATAEAERPIGDSPQPPEAVEAPPKAAAAAATAALTMDELLEKVAEVKGMPASLAKRSAEARSKKTGESVEEVLAEWAGIEPPTGDSPPVTAEEEPAGVSSPVTAKEEPTSEAAPGPEVIEASPAEAEGPAEDEDPAVVRGGYPKWLAAAFVLIPLLAVAYILVAPNGPECGTAGQLLVDPVTGESLNCDGTEYGSTTIDYFAEGAGIYNQCVACHSADGSGGAGPSFAGGAVLTTFPSGSCTDHQEWVRLGTAGWPDTTYGATNRPVGGFGLMPSFASMTDEDIASVVLYERVQFGGQPLDEALTDCGFSEPDGEGGASTEAAGS
jgi:mono/diheme cytochrome c family protein